MPPVVPAILTDNRADASEMLAVLGENNLPLHIDLIESSWGTPTLTLKHWLAIKNDATYWPTHVTCHLMVDDPLRYISDVALIAHMVAIHVETINNFNVLVQAVSDANLDLMLTAKPHTVVDYRLPVTDWQVMGVDPGKAGQSQLSDTPQRVNDAHRNGRATILAVDGGVTLENAPWLVASGANTLVVNSTYWRAKNPDNVVRSLTSIVTGGGHGVSGSD